MKYLTFSRILIIRVIAWYLFPSFIDLILIKEKKLFDGIYGIFILDSSFLTTIEIQSLTNAVILNNEAHSLAFKFRVMYGFYACIFKIQFHANIPAHVQTVTLVKMK